MMSLRTHSALHGHTGLLRSLRSLTMTPIVLLLIACPSSNGESKGSAAWKPESFLYVLQAEQRKRSRTDAITSFAASGRDLLVLDYSYDSGRFGKWSKAELNSMRKAHKGRKIVSYISIGEAENYRAYWQPVWDRDNNSQPDAGAPDFLLEGNPHWKGNYRVKYWQAAWQKLIIQYVDEIVSQGFDGIYLDIVDAFQHFEYNPLNNQWVKDRINDETGQSYRQDMVDWVLNVAQAARRHKKDFLIIPQNGSQLLSFDAFGQTIDAIALEDFFTEGNRKQPAKRLRHVLDFLAPIRETKKPILVVEYPTQERLQRFVIQEAAKHGFIPLVTDRRLKTVGYATVKQVDAAEADKEGSKEKKRRATKRKVKVKHD